LGFDSAVTIASAGSESSHAEDEAKSELIASWETEVDGSAELAA